MNSDFAVPAFPKAPEEYEQAYMDELLRQLTVLIGIIQSNGVLRGSKMNLSQLPTSATGLRTGDVWNDAGTLKIV